MHAHNISYQLSSYIPTITFLSQFIAIRTIESSSSIHRTSKVTKTAKSGKHENRAIDAIHEIHRNGENHFSNHKHQNKDPTVQNEDSRV